uniref:Uncharacterized protein n=1 Tax=Sinocyclocheilus anshuiensis TaxID=1608454 RepID=A0A671RFQ0_9TELE
METQSQTSSAAEKKKKVETIVATKSAPTCADISEKAVASSTTSNARHSNSCTNVVSWGWGYLNTHYFCNSVICKIHSFQIKQNALLLTGDQGCEVTNYKYSRYSN